MPRYIDADLINRDTFSDCENATECVYAIGNIPTANVVKIIYSNWIDHYVSTDEDLNGYFDGDYECLECGCVKEETTPYCPMCGRKLTSAPTDER